jgi:hypothetical protein
MALPLAKLHSASLSISHRTQNCFLDRAVKAEDMGFQHSGGMGRLCMWSQLSGCRVINRKIAAQYSFIVQETVWTAPVRGNRFHVDGGTISCFRSGSLK